MAPKRKSPSSLDVEAPRKKVKSTKASSRTSPESQARIGSGQLSSNDENDPTSDNEAPLWELMDGDNWEKLVVLEQGQSMPERLTIRLCHLKTKKVKTCKYKIPNEEIDWEDPKHIGLINNWRNSIRRRNGFELKKGYNAWNPEETAWLNLFLERISDASTAGSDPKQPKREQITDALNNFFDSRPDRTVDGITSHIKQKYPELGEVLRSLPKPKKGEAAFIPSITEEDLIRYMGKQDEPSEPTGKEKDSDSVECASASRAELLPQTQATSPYISPCASPTRDASVILTPPEDVRQLEYRDWIFPRFPMSDEEALTRHCEAVEVGGFRDTWMVRTEEALNNRLNADSKDNRRDDKGDFSRWSWFRDPEERKKKGILEHHFEGESFRKPTAAAVNGLLEYAVIPPFGYLGPLDGLISKRLLTQQEILIAETSQVGVEKYYQYLDSLYIDKIKMSKTKEPKAKKPKIPKTKNKKPKTGN